MNYLSDVNTVNISGILTKDPWEGTTKFGIQTLGFDINSTRRYLQPGTNKLCKNSCIFTCIIMDRNILNYAHNANLSKGYYICVVGGVLERKHDMPSIILLRGARCTFIIDENEPLSFNKFNKEK